MVPDTRVIHTHNRYEVLGQRFEVQFKDGQAVWLHLVRAGGADAMFLRALVEHGKPVRVFDVCGIAPVLDLEIRQTHQRDVPGLVFHTLRLTHASATSFRQKVQAIELESWRPAPATKVAVHQLALPPEPPAEWARRRYWPVTAREVL
jgi:hypothetical protein